MAGLGACTSLVELYLSHNGITCMHAELAQLTALKVRARRRKSSAVHVCACMCFASVHAHACGRVRARVHVNACSCMCARALASVMMHSLARAQVLDVSNNRITAVEHLAGLTALEDLWLNDNAIPSLDGLEEALADQRDSLTTIYLENNPAAGAPDYKARLLALLPRLVQLDADVLQPAVQALQEH